MADNVDFRVRHGLAVTNTATIESTLTSVSITSGALKVAGGVGIAKDVFVGGIFSATGTIYSENNLSVAGSATIQSTDDSTGINSGALVVSGGAGLGGNLYVNGNIVSLSTTTSADTTSGSLVVSGGVGIAGDLNVGGSAKINSSATSISSQTGALVVTGGLGVGQAAYFGHDVFIGGTLYGTVLGSISTATNLFAGTRGQVPYQTGPGSTAFFGPGTAGQLLMSDGAEPPVYTNTSSIFVGRSTYANNIAGGTGGYIPYQSSVNTTVFVTGGFNGGLLKYQGGVPIWDSTATLFGGVGSATTISGQTLKITSGGIGVAGDSFFQHGITVSGISTFNEGVVFNDTVTFNGTATYVYSSNSVLTDSLLVLHANSSGAWTFSDNLDIGIKGDYYDTARNTATSFFLGFVPEERYLIFLVDGTEVSAGNFTGTYGDLKLNTIRLVSTQTSTSSDTGALVVPGGVGVSGDVNLKTGAKLTIGSGLIAPAPNSAIHLVDNINSPLQTHIINVNSGASASADLIVGNDLGTDDDYYVNVGIGSTNYNYPDFSVAGPSDGYIFGKGGNLKIATGTRNKFIEFWVGGTGNTSTAYESTLTSTGTKVLTVNTGAVVVHNLTQSTSTNTGALQIRGGVGIGGDLWIGGIIYGTASIDGIVTTATNLANGTPGQVPYQSANGITGFFGPGTAGQFLKSNGAAAPSYVDTATMYVGMAVTSTNVHLGGVGQLVYQAASGQTSFIGTGTLGQLLVSQGTTSTGPTFVSTSNIYVKNSEFTDKMRGGTAGQILYQSAADTTEFVSEGTAGQLLMSRGASALGPNFVNTSSIYVGRAALADLATLALQANNATTSTNLAGGAAGSIPYQSAAGATTFLAIGTSSYILLSNGSTPYWGTQSGLGAGSADTIKVQNNTSTTTTHYLTFVNTASGFANVFVSAETGLTYVPSRASLGINTNSPQYTLDVNSTTNAIIRAYGSSIGRLSLQNSSKHYSLSVQGTDLLIYDESSSNTRVRLDTNGNVGVGITPSTFKFDVLGTARISGVTSLTDTTTATNTTTGALKVSGGIGVGDSIYVKNKVGYVNTSNVSRVYQYYNAATDSLDTVFE